jgi:predicted transcriptional regulator
VTTVSNKEKPKQLNVEIPAELDKELNVFCAVNDRTKREIVEKAIRQFLGAQQAKN